MMHEDGTAGLQKLAAEIDGSTFAMSIIRQGRVPCLRVTSRDAPQLSEDIYAGRGWFWWSWAERIAACDDPAAAAAKVARVLQAVTEPVA